MRAGLDIGGTKTDAVAVDDGGRIVARVRRTTRWGSDGVLATIRAAVAELEASLGMPVDAVGVGMPGQVEGGTVRHAVNLGIVELDVAGALASLGVPVALENDVKAAAVGACALHGGFSIGYLNLGTGVAAGIVSEGVLWRGVRGAAGELGHVSIDPAGPVCRCGQRGCIEALAGGAAIAERWNRPGALPVRDVFDAADAADPVAAGLRRDLVLGVAAAVRVLVLTVDVEAVMLGGGITGLGARLSDPVREELRASAAASPFLRSLALADRMELLPAGSSAAALGAALLGAAETERVSHG